MQQPPLDALQIPAFDPAPIFELARGNFATELLAAAVHHFKLFEHLRENPHQFNTLRRKMGLAERPAAVLITALKAMGLIYKDDEARLALTPVAREHLGGGPFDVADYIGLGAESPGVLEMVSRLKSNKPANVEREAGAAFIYRAGIESAMEHEQAARALTLALAGRSKNIAPVLAANVNLDAAKLLLDVGGGTGIYSIALLQKNPHLRAIVWDRPEVLKVTAEFAAAYGVSERLECRAGDMFTDAIPEGADVVLLSNILHDWDVPECRQLVQRCASALPPGGRLLIHDALLNDDQDGPLPVALYSAALYSLTEGRAYSRAEYAIWLTEAGLTFSEPVPTLIHCSVMTGTKSNDE